MKPELKKNDQKKRVMKRLLQVVFVVAWLPILWLLLSATLGKMLFALVGIAWFAQSVVVLCSLLFIFLAFRYYGAISKKIFDK